jgi:hypothetical protein
MAVFPLRPILIDENQNAAVWLFSERKPIRSMPCVQILEACLTEAGACSALDQGVDLFSDLLNKIIWLFDQSQ